MPPDKLLDTLPSAFTNVVPNLHGKPSLSALSYHFMADKRQLDLVGV
jgi:hypothetical protein